MRAKYIVASFAASFAALRVLSGGAPSGASPADWAFRMTEDARSVVVENIGYAPDAADVVCRWNTYRDGLPVAAGVYPLHVFRQGPVRPGQAVTNAVPAVVAAVGARGGEMALRVRIERPDPDGARPVTLAEDQIDFPCPTLPALPPCVRPPSVARCGDTVTFSADGVTYAFDGRRGVLASVVTGDWFKKEWMKKPAEFALPAKYRAVRATMSDPVVTNGTAVIASVVRCEPASDAGRVPFDVLTRWIVRGDGRLVWQCAVRAETADLPCARVGFRFRFDAERPLFQYFGKPPDGPFAGRGHVDEDGPDGFRAEEVRALAFDAGWHHLSFAAGTRFDAVVTRTERETDLTLSVPVETRVGGRPDIPLAFVMSPRKRLAAWASLEDLLSAQSGNGTVTNAASAAQVVAE